jgi:hypothetical protein
VGPVVPLVRPRPGLFDVAGLQPGRDLVVDELPEDPFPGHVASERVLEKLSVVVGVIEG